MTTPTATAQIMPLRQILHVRRGQSQMLHWPAGTAILALRGGVWLSGTPHWLGEQLLRPRRRIEAHATHVMPDAGWVVLWAESDAVLQVVPGEPALSGRNGVVQPAWAAMAAAVAAVRRRIFGRGPVRLA